MSTDFKKRLEDILNEDKRYKHDAYEFIMQALSFAQKKLKKKGHLTARELLEGVRDLAFEQFGPMARNVLSHWGVNSTADFGEIVFNMIDKGLLFKTEKDSKEDFKAVYDFGEVFDSKKYKFDLN